MGTTTYQARGWVVGLRLLMAVCLFLSSGLMGWTGSAWADSLDAPGFTGASKEALIPGWFLADAPLSTSVTPPTAPEIGFPLAFDDGPVDQIEVRDRLGDAGTKVITYTLTADESLVLWAAGYYSSVFVENQTVTWTVTGGIGEVSPTVGVSTTFYANTVGSGAVIATHAVTPTLTDATGTITVTAGALAALVVQTVGGDGGAAAGDRTMTADETWTLYAEGYDADGNYVGPQSATWSVAPALGAFSANPASSTSFEANLVGSGAITATAGVFSDATGALTVDPGALHHFLVDAPASGTAGVGFGVAITAQDADNNTVTSFSNSVDLTANGSDIQPTSASLGSGVWSGAVTLTVAGNRVVTATYGSAAGSDTLTVNPDDLDHLTVTPDAAALDPGGAQPFSAQGYDAYDNPISGLSYTWAVINGGGTISAIGLFTAGNPDGLYPDTVRATANDGGGPVSSTATVTVNNVAPTANAGGPYSGNEGSVVTFSGAGSDGNGDPLTYEWDLDYDGSNFTVDYVGATTATLFVDDVSRQVAFRVTDDDDAATVDVTDLTVHNVLPAVNAGNDKDTAEGTTVFFNGSFTDPGSLDPHTVEWDFGDGSAGTGSLSTSHVYTDNGTFIVTLTVTDDDGQSSDTLTANVDNVAPTVLAGNDQSADEGDTVFFNGAFTDPGAGDTHTIEWDFGDGDTAAGSVSTSHVFTAADSFTVRLTVRDDDGGESSDTLIVTVTNVPPTANIGAPPTQTAGVDVLLDASGSTEPGQNIVSYDWDLDNDGQYDDASGVTAVANWTAADDYTVGLRVTDAEGSTDTDSAVITVEPAALDRFVVSVPGSSTAGVAFGTVITAEDVYGNVITDWDQDVTLSTTNGGVIDPAVALGSAFVDGVWSGPVSLTAAGSNRDVTASHDGRTGQDTLHIEPAAATNLTFSAIGDQTAGADSELFTLTAFDPYGNQDTNYDGTHNLLWSGLSVSPDGTPPAYPRDRASFNNGVAIDFFFTPYAAETAVTLQVSEIGGPTGASSVFAVSHAAASTFEFSTVSDQVAGSPGTIGALTAEDDYGNTATAYAGNKTLNWSGLGNGPNGDPPDYPANPVNFVNGVASSLIFTPYLAETGVALAASEGGVSGVSNDLDVAVGSTVGAVVVESAAGGAGSEVTTHDMVIYDTLTVYAAGYDAWGNYIADLTVDWSGAGVAVGQLSPLDGASTTLTPIVGGTATIVAEYSAVITDATGLITVRAPLLHVSLADDPDPVDAGGALTFTVFYSNTGNAAADNTLLTLTPDVNVNLGSGYGQARVWDLGVLAASASDQVVVAGSVRSPMDNGTILISTAEIDSQQTAVVSATAETTVQSQPQLGITKSDLQDPVPAGGSIVYNLEFANTGNMNATGVVITDVIPANTQFQSASHGGVYHAAQGVVVWNVGTLIVGATPYRTLEVRVDSPLPSGTVITNTGYQIDSQQTSPVSGPDVTTAILSPTLTLDQSGNPDPVAAGELVTFTIYYSNAGSGAATQVVISDTIPQYAVFYSASAGYTLVNDQIVWNIGAVAGHTGGSVWAVFRITSPLDDGSAILNYVSIDSFELEPTTYLDLVYVSSSPELHITTVGAPDPVPAGAQLLYTLAYTNSGNANATSVVITDRIPANTGFVSASDGGVYAAGVVTWDLGALSGRNLAGQMGTGSVTLLVAVTSPLTNGTWLRNTAAITSAEGSHDAVEVETRVSSLPVLTLDVSDSPDPIKGGQTLVYTVDYANTGNANATGVQLTVDYDSQLIFHSAHPMPTSGNATWHLPLLPGEGGAGQVVITLTAGALAPDAVLRSRFYLDSDQTAAVSQAESTAAQAVALQLGAAFDASTPYPGKQITYTLHYTNAGDVSATGVELTAGLPDGVTYVTSGWTHAGGGLYRRTLPGSLAAGASGSVEFIVQVNSTADHRLPLGLTSIKGEFTIADDGASGPELVTSDNQVNTLIGIPDLVIDQIQVSPSLPTPDRPVTFTVWLRNQGTGLAGNPNVPGGGGFWVDLYIDPDPAPQSFPWNVDGDVFIFTQSLAAGASRQIVFVLSDGLSGQFHEVYAKVDNYPPNPTLPLWQQSSLIPESDEGNNVFSREVLMGEADTFFIYLPSVLRNP
ncbi:MAG: PKD domain-containing protein [Chloroflexota bacterium]